MSCYGIHFFFKMLEILSRFQKCNKKQFSCWDISICSGRGNQLLFGGECLSFAVNVPSEVLKTSFFQFYTQSFQYFCIKWGSGFIKKANKISVIWMTFETPNYRSTLLFFMFKSIRVDNVMNKFWSYWPFLT